MKITYIGHSGFLVELPELYLLFDYTKGQIPEIARDKNLLVFVSHAHGDHYNEKIWELANTHLHVSYILSDDICEHIPPSPHSYQIHLVSAGQTYQIGTDVSIQTVFSTDEGVAFVVKHGIYSVFHAGDLNLWTWTEDEEAINQDRLRRFMLAMAEIADSDFDVAFFPIDPRQESACGDGMTLFLQAVKAKYVYPMHFWDDYSVISAYRTKNPQYRDCIIEIEHEGQGFFNYID
ncbi:MAG: MBL fold metallo-hydrolase [Lachnospiraceae bacterium]|jgi:L-ascorbate metabolism protein UlaG (beta-lactamase superfamily)|nr:MBL fold metallo-hydrolase [Lachnospiraceae bacterium]